METIEEIVLSLKADFNTLLENVKFKLSQVSAGRVNLAPIEVLNVEVYESQQKLCSVAAVSLPDPRVVVIKPYDLGTLKEICKSLTPQIKAVVSLEADCIKAIFPPITEETRRAAVKELKVDIENYKASVRRMRQSSLKHVKNLEASNDENKCFNHQIEILIKESISQLEFLFSKKKEEMVAI